MFNLGQVLFGNINVLFEYFPGIFHPKEERFGTLSVKLDQAAGIFN